MTDLSPLKGMPLTWLRCTSLAVSDLAPLKDLPLKFLWCDIKTDRDVGLLHSIKTLVRINDQSAAEFFKERELRAAHRVDEAWIKEVAALPADKQVDAVAAKLKERNPGFDGKVTPIIEQGVVVRLKFLTDNVTDISPVRALAGLKGLDCPGTYPLKGRLSDLSPLTGMKLTALICYGNPVTDLSPIKDMKLTHFDCGDSPLADVSPLAGMKLEVFLCLETKVTDLSPLRGAPLRFLHWDFKSERDLELVRSFKTLTEINGRSASDFLKEASAKTKP